MQNLRQFVELSVITVVCSFLFYYGLSKTGQTQNLVTLGVTPTSSAAFPHGHGNKIPRHHHQQHQRPYSIPPSQKDSKEPMAKPYPDSTKSKGNTNSNNTSNNNNNNINKKKKHNEYYHYYDYEEANETTKQGTSAKLSIASILRDFFGWIVGTIGTNTKTESQRHIDGLRTVFDHDYFFLRGTTIEDK
jgi:hypothetical protein